MDMQNGAAHSEGFGCQNIGWVQEMRTLQKSHCIEMTHDIAAEGRMVLPKWRICLSPGDVRQPGWIRHWRLERSP